MNQQHDLAAKLFAVLVIPFCVACSSDGDDEEEDTGPTKWSGQTYVLNIRARNWTEPKGAVQDFSAYVPPFLLGVNDGPSASYEVMVATMTTTDDTAATPVAQDMCNLTSTLAGSGVAIGTEEFPMHIRHSKEDLYADAVVRGLKFTDVLPPDGLAWPEDTEAGLFEGTMDARDIIGLVTLLGEERTPDTLCAELLNTVPPTECQPCPHDGAPYCVTLKAWELGATKSDFTISPVTSIAATCNHGQDF